MARKQVTLAKISRPRAHDVLARTRLHGVLDKACARVVWLSWQPGAGKLCNENTLEELHAIIQRTLATTSA